MVNSLFLIWLISTFCQLFIVSPAQIAIDFGSEFYKVSLVKGKSYEMVENANSKTKTPNVIFFKGNQRLFEAEALSKKVKHPKETFTYLSNFIGEPFSSPFLKQNLQQYFLHYHTEENNKTFSTQFNIHYHNKVIPMPVEGLIAMLLRHSLSMTERYAHSAVKESLLTIPSFYTYKQRLALIQAAKIANLPLVGFVSDNIASAVHYSLKQSFDKPAYYIYYNMGAAYTQVSLVSYAKTTVNSQEIQVLAEAYDKTLGGNRFTRNLAIEIIDRFNKKNGLDVNKAQAYHKVFPQAKKYQEILSANKEAQISILNIDKGINFNDKITRKEFEAINKDAFKQIYEPILQVLELSHMNITQINQIELIGGGIRVPFVQKVLRNKLGNYSTLIGTHLNGDDSIAMGAGYILSNITKTLKSRRITVLNGNGPSSTLYARITTSTENGNNSSNNLTTPTNPFSSKDNPISINKEEIIAPLRSSYNQRKVLSLKHNADLSIEIIERMEQDNTSITLMQFNITGLNAEINFIKTLTQSNSVIFPHINLAFAFDNLGELSLTSSASFDVPFYYTNMTEINPNTSQSIQFDYVPYHLNELSKQQKDNLTLTLNQSLKLNLSETVVTHLKNQLRIGSIRKQIIKRDLKVTQEHYSPKGLDDSDIAAISAKLNAIDKYEADKSLIIEQKNKLETLLYTKRAWINNNNSIQFGTEEEHQEAKNALKEISEWFDVEGDDASYEELGMKVWKLTKAFEEFDDRVKVNRERMIAIEKFEVNAKNIVIKAGKMVIESPWIREYYEANFTSYLKKMKMYLEENVSKQNDQKLYEIPLLVSLDIMENITQINIEYEKMSKMEKPRHPPLPENAKLSKIRKGYQSLTELLSKKYNEMNNTQ